MNAQLKTYKLLNMAAGAVIVLVSFIIALFLFMRFYPVDVLDNKTWVLCTHPISSNGSVRWCADQPQTFRVAETITVNIVSDKLKSVGGYFTTTVECKNELGVFVSYPISEQHVNRAVGHVETSIDTSVRRAPNLPATCRIAYILEYDVYSFRSFSEYNFTNEFTLIP